MANTTKANPAMLKDIRDEFERCMPVFVALGDKVRQQMILALICAGCEGLCVSEITEKTHLSRPAVSHHLKVLKDAGVVQIQKAGTKNKYYLSSETSLAKLCCMSDHISTLAKVLEKEQL